MVVVGILFIFVPRLFDLIDCGIELTDFFRFQSEHITHGSEGHF